MDFGTDFPRQTIPYKQKGEKWRHAVMDWVAARTYFNYAPIRSDVVRMKTNYDLVNGIIHMDDVKNVLNPSNLTTAFVPDKIQHYPIINSKLNTLRGEEAARVFDWRVIVTNPFAVSQIEEEKRKQFDTSIQQIVENTEITDDQAQQQIADAQDYYSYSWQDRRELAANELLRHYAKEQSFKQKFNDGFFDACVCSREVYQCAIECGEPVLVKLNPLKLRVLQNGYSNKVEDADLLIYEDYWSRGRILDVYGDDLKESDVKWLCNEVPLLSGQEPIGPAGNVNEAYPFIGTGRFVGEEGVFVTEDDYLSGVFDELVDMDGGIGSGLLPYDVVGNVRVLRAWWKSKRKILVVKSYNDVTGEEEYDFYPETYIPNEAAGEEATALWINEMWEGTKIGDRIYARIRPCIMQHNSISCPSRCHAGIVGTIYNINESMPYSLVDMMKPYNYLYDAVHAKLVEMIASNWGKIVVLDLAKKPRDWQVDKWVYFAKANKVLVEDSFNEGNKGASTGKLAGGLNNASKGYIDADWGQSIQYHIELLQWTKDSMSELVGINRQREGNTYSRETVGGIERAVLQSSYITDWLFQQHEDTKKRVMECFLEECKGALRGRSKKFQYILSDGSRKILSVDGDSFCECDYGLIPDNSADTQKLNSQIDVIGQAALQNQSLDFYSILQLYSSASVSEKLRIVRNAQARLEQRQAQAQQQQQQLEEQKIQADQQAKLQELQMRDALNQRDNDTKVKVAELGAQAEFLRLGIYADENSEELRREELGIDRDKLKAEIEKLDKELNFKNKELAQKKEIELKKIETQKQIAGAKAAESKSNKQ